MQRAPGVVTEEGGQGLSGALHHGALVAILLGALLLRVSWLDEVPAGLFVDEAALGLNAWSLLTEGTGEDGTRWPLYFWSLGTSYKNPVFIYSALLPVSLLGLSEFSIRLVSALYGTLAVFALYLVGRELWGRGAALSAAFVLALTPWHLHFSRVAFELITFPTLWLLSWWAFLRAVRCNGWYWLLTGLLLSLTMLSYVPAKMFVLLMLPVLLLSHFRRIDWRSRALWSGAALFCIVLTRIVYFDLVSAYSAEYFLGNTWLGRSGSFAVDLQEFVRRFSAFFSLDFLIRWGDPLPRHGLPRQGVLLATSLLLVPCGLLGLLLDSRRSATAVVLSWAALYPVAAALMNEIPSASRGIIGSPLVAVLTGYGVQLLTARLPYRVLRGAGSGVVALVLMAVAVEGHDYLRRYFLTYPQHSARGIGGFQYGYREIAEFLHARGGEFQERILSASEVNRPETILRFHEVSRYHAEPLPEYRLLRPESFEHYFQHQPTLFVARPSDLLFFEEWRELGRVIAPGNKHEFIFIDLIRRAIPLTGWRYGAVRRATDDAFHHPPFSGSTMTWESVPEEPVTVNLNALLAHRDPRYRGNPEFTCADLELRLPPLGDGAMTLRVFGSEDPLALWLDGELLLPATTLQRHRPLRIPLPEYSSGRLLQARSCEGVGDWWFATVLEGSRGSFPSNLLE